MKEDDGRTVFITGGASGMGLLAATMLAAQGAHVVIFNRQAAAAQAALTQISAARHHPGQRVAGYLADVADRELLLAAFALAAREVGAPDIVINMAGIGGVAPLTEMPFEMFDRQIKINLYGSRNVVDAALVTMAPRRQGSIVLVGSMGGFIPVYGYTAYGTSKFAVVGFAQCLRPELKPLGIRLMCFCPGEVDTPALTLERSASHPATMAFKSLGGTMAMDAAVNDLIAGIERNRFLIVPGWRSRLIYWAYRLTPLSIWNAVSDLIIARTVSR